MSDALDDLILGDQASTPLGLCSMCDVWVGFSAVGVVTPPSADVIGELIGVGSPDPNDLTAWLGSHCWICYRSAEEVQADPKGRRNRGRKA